MSLALNEFLTLNELLFDWQKLLKEHIQDFHELAKKVSERDAELSKYFEKLDQVFQVLKEAELAQRHIDTAIVRVEVILYLYRKFSFSE